MLILGVFVVRDQPWNLNLSGCELSVNLWLHIVAVYLQPGSISPTLAKQYAIHVKKKKKKVLDLNVLIF